MICVKQRVFIRPIDPAVHIPLVFTAAHSIEKGIKDSQNFALVRVGTATVFTHEGLVVRQQILTRVDLYSGTEEKDSYECLL